MGFRFNNKKLQRIRKEEGWTIAKLAQYAGCSQTQMTRLLSGERLLSQTAIDNLRKNAEISPEEIDVGEFIPMGPAPGTNTLSEQEWMEREEQRRERRVERRAKYRATHPRPTLTEEEKWIRASLRPY